MAQKSGPKKCFERETDAEKKSRQTAKSMNLEYLEAKLAELNAEIEKKRTEVQDGVNQSRRGEDGADGSSSDRLPENSSPLGNDSHSDEEPVVEEPLRDAESVSSDPPQDSQLKDQLENEDFSDVELPPPRRRASEEDDGSEDPPHEPEINQQKHDEEPGLEDPSSPRESEVDGGEDSSQKDADFSETSSDLFETSARSNESPARENNNRKSPEKEGCQDQQSSGSEQEGVTLEEYRRLEHKLEKRTKELKRQKTKYQQLKEANDELKETCTHQATEIMRLQQNEPELKAFSIVQGIDMTSAQIEEVSRDSKNGSVFAQKLAISLLGAEALRGMSVTGTGYSQTGDKIKKARIPENVLNFIYGKVLEKNLIEKGSKGKYAVLAASNTAVINRALAEKIANLNKAYVLQQTRNTAAQAPVELPIAKPTQKRIEADSSRHRAKQRKSQPATPLHTEPVLSKRLDSRSSQKQHEQSRSRPPMSGDLGKSTIDSGLQRKAKDRTPHEDEPKSARSELASENRSSVPKITNHQQNEQKAHRGTAPTVRPSANSDQRSSQASKSQGRPVRSPSMTRPPAQLDQPESVRKQPRSGQEQKFGRSEHNTDKRLRTSQSERPASGNRIKSNSSQPLPLQALIRHNKNSSDKPAKKLKTHHHSQQ